MKNLATPFHRIVAHVIDISLLALVYVLMFYRIASAATLSDLLTQGIWALIYLTLIGLVYNVVNAWLTAKSGGSIGKLICGLKVTNHDGSNISFKKALFRNIIGYSISSLLLGLGYWWVFKDKNRQTWHDQFVSTFVVTTNASGFTIGVVAAVLLLAANAYLFVAALTSASRNVPFYTQTITDMGEEFQKSFAPSPTPPIPTIVPRATSMPQPTQIQTQPTSTKPTSTKPTLAPKRAATAEASILTNLSSAFNGSALQPYQISLQTQDGTPVELEGYSTTLSTTPGVVGDYFTKTGFTKIDSGWTKNTSFCAVINTTASSVEVACIPF